MNILTITLLAAVLPSVVIGQGNINCAATNTLQHEQRRGQNIPNPTDLSQSLCDNNVSGLYRVDTMLASMFVPTGKCGTSRPVFIMDNLPDPDQTLPLTACTSTTMTSSGSCENAFSVDVTNCGNYYVYDLKPLDCTAGNSAYCLHGNTDGSFDPPIIPPTTPTPTIEPPSIPTTCELNGHTPWITNIATNGYCDRGIETCTSAFVEVTPRTALPLNFLQPPSCCFREMWVDVNGPLISAPNLTYTIGIRTACNRVFCPIPNGAFPETVSRRVPGWLVSLSIDRVNYGNEKVFLPYDSRCVFCSYADTAECVPVCTWSSTSCFINGRCYAPNVLNPGNPCQKCDPAQSTTQWSANDRSCTIAGVCYMEDEQHAIKFCLFCKPDSSTDQFTAANGCHVNNVCYAHNQPDPDNSCRVCDINHMTLEQFSISSGCYIGGTCYQEGQSQSPSFPCNVCRNSVNPNGFTTEVGCVVNGVCHGDGAAVTQNGVCNTCNATTGSLVPQGCVSSGTCYGDGALIPPENCFTCDGNNGAIVPVSGGCNIGGNCYAEGANESPALFCRVCRQNVNQFAFTTEGGCNIGGNCYAEGATESPALFCRVCRQNVNQFGFTTEGGCNIGGTCYAEGATESPALFCRVCRQNVNQFAFTTEGCEASGACYSNGATDPNNICRTCVSGSFTPISGKCVIDGVCYDDLQRNPTDYCEQCQANINQVGWVTLLVPTSGSMQITCPQACQAISTSASQIASLCPHINVPFPVSTYDGICTLDLNIYNAVTCLIIPITAQQRQQVFTFCSAKGQGMSVNQALALPVVCPP